MFSIRKATTSDVDWLLIQLQKFSAFYSEKYPMFPADEIHAKKQLEYLFNDHYFKIAEDETHKPIGFMAGFKTKSFMNPELNLLTELFWWTDEEHRKTGAGLALLEDFIQEGKDTCHWIVLTLEHNSPVHEKVFLDRGFRVKEKSFLMEI